MKDIIKLWHSLILFCTVRKLKAAAAIKQPTFVLIPVGLFIRSVVGIQGHHYQNLQKLLSAAEDCPCVWGVCLFHTTRLLSVFHIFCHLSGIGSPAALLCCLTFPLVRMKAEQESDSLDKPSHRSRTKAPEHLSLLLQGFTHMTIKIFLAAIQNC